MRKTREKIKMGNVLFWIVIIVIIVFMALAIYCFVFGMCVENKAPWFMASFTSLVALFTCLLWRATKKYAETTEGVLKQSKQAVEQSRLLAKVTKEYTEVTKELLNQSEKAFKQSRIVFLANIIKDLVDYAEEQKNVNLSPVEYIKRTLLTFGKIDKEMAKEIWEIMETWAAGTTYEVSMKKDKDSFMKKLDNL